MLQMVEKWIRGKICHVINWYAKANIEYKKYYNKPKKFHI